MTLQFSDNLLNNLRQAKHIVALTGAGVSAESGVPTFREAQTGLWAKYRPEDLATPRAFLHNPSMVWDWYNWRRGLISKTNPNPGHYALVKMEQRLCANNKTFTLLTQNVDNLHQCAGSKEIFELHGNIFRTKCFECEQTPHPNPAHPEKAHCTHCGGLLRPDVVWFGESLSPTVLNAALNAAKNCDIFLSIGTSSVVQPAASLPVLALENGATLIEINPNPTPLTNLADHVFPSASGEILPALVDAIW